MALSFSEAKGIPIAEYLSTLGVEPTQIKGNDYWYQSPFRHERTPSFKINTKLNVWYDHGTGEGGTIIDLGIKLYDCTRVEFLKKLEKNICGVKIPPPTSSDIETRKLKVLSSFDLTRQDLLEYVLSRKIDDYCARQYCREVEFEIGQKKHTAVGFQNRSGGFELRNSWFKGSSSPKDISFLDNGSDDLCVVEGFMDFLSLLTLNRRGIIELPSGSNFLILNSLSFLRRAIPILKDHKTTHLYLDNDLAAKNAMQGLTLGGLSFRDGSDTYAPFKDVNEFLVKAPPAKTDLARPKGIRP